MPRRIFAIAIALAMLGMPVHAAQKNSDQTIAKWTVTKPDHRDENTLSIRHGMLENRTLTYGVGPAPETTVTTVRLSRVQRFEKTTDQDPGNVPAYDIIVDGKLTTDVQVTMYGLTGPASSQPAIAQFGPDQEALRDDIYAKLCALIGQSP